MCSFPVKMLVLKFNFNVSGWFGPSNSPRSGSSAVATAESSALTLMADPATIGKNAFTSKMHLFSFVVL